MRLRRACRRRRRAPTRSAARRFGSSGISARSPGQHRRRAVALVGLLEQRLHAPAHGGAASAAFARFVQPLEREGARARPRRRTLGAAGRHVAAATWRPALHRIEHPPLAGRTSSPATPCAPCSAKAAGEHREAAEHRFLRRIEQAVAPLQRGAQRLLALGRAGAAARQQLQRLVEPLQHAGRTEQRHPRRGQLERERNALEPAADLARCLGSVIVELETPHRPPRRGRQTTASAGASLASASAPQRRPCKRITCSSRRPSGSWLVASTVTCGAASSRHCTIDATAPSRCSQLSSTISMASSGRSARVQRGLRVRAGAPAPIARRHGRRRSVRATVGHPRRQSRRRTLPSAKRWPRLAAGVRQPRLADAARTDQGHQARCRRSTSCNCRARRRGRSGRRRQPAGAAAWRLPQPAPVAPKR